MSNYAEAWATLYDIFDPRKPVDNPALRAPRPYSPADKMIASLRRAPRPKKILFKGTSGNGKTTELLYVVSRAAQDRFVIFFDFEQHFRATMRDEAALQTAQPWELAFLVGVALWRAGVELGIGWDPHHAASLATAYNALLNADEDVPGAQVDITKVAAAVTVVAGGGLFALGATALAPVAMVGLTALIGSVKWEMPFLIGGKKALPDQDPNVMRLVEAVNVMVVHVQGTHRPVLLALDGLDHLGAEAANRHFVTSGILSELSCSLILTGPASVSRTRARFDETCTLDNVPVVDRRAPLQPGPGAAFFHDVWRRRAGGLAGALTAPQLDRLAWASGGLLRHFCRLVRGLAERAYAADVASIADEWLDAEIDERRRDLEDGMKKEEFRLLEAVAADPNHELPESPLTQALLDEHRLVPYPNESTWYFPHPLLTLKKVHVPPSSGSSVS